MRIPVMHRRNVKYVFALTVKEHLNKHKVHHENNGYVTNLYFVYYEMLYVLSFFSIW